MNKVITVSREFGSGGRELGVKLAEALGIPFYDKELISMAADDINIAEEAFRKYDEHVIEDDPLDHKIHHSFSELYKVPMSDQIFVAQSNVIRRLASHGPCVIVGRCSDYVLRDNRNCLRVFFSAPMENRMKRVMERRHLSEKDARQKIQKEDKWRADNYRYYTGRIWGAAGNFDLTVNAALGEDYIEMCIREAMKR